MLMPTPSEIYQSYLHGPAAGSRLFEQPFVTLALYGPPEPDQQQRTIESQAEPIDRLQAQLSQLEAQLWQARTDNHRLRRRHAELELLTSKDSHNSSRPPSSDPPWAKRTRSLRRPSSKSPGGQRELTCCSELEEERKVWAAPLKHLLLEIKREVDEARVGGDGQLRSERVAELTTGQEELVREGLEAQPAA
jgi:hypothetical protein